MDMKLELVPVPVTDIDRAKEFYLRLGFHADVDVRPADGVRVVQLTPPGSACSITLTAGLPASASGEPGSIRGLHLVVRDIAAARSGLLGRGIPVGDITDMGGVLYAEIVDPDGNTCVLQQMPWRTGDAY
jgi:catechol 2,3-dioxygenase-like lactoylglutathione lyase family enzyme